jgi:microcystin-dependent protein
MAILNNPEDFVSGENVTAAKLNNLVDGATFLSGAGEATDGSTLEVNDGEGGDGSLRVKDLGITTAKLADGAVSEQKIADSAITASKIAPSAARAMMPPGGLIPYAGATVPSGWLLCDGGTIGDASSGAGSESADYETLFDLIKTLYGNAGTEVFANGDTVSLPDLRGRVVAGLGGNLIDVSAVVNGATNASTNVALDGNEGTLLSGMTVTGSGIGVGVTIITVTDQQNIILSSAVTLADDTALTFVEGVGSTGGAKTHTLLEAELPTHDHLTLNNAAGNSGNNVTATNSASFSTSFGGDSSYLMKAPSANPIANIGLSSETGGDSAHNNVQPTIILNYIIKY